ncbi:hypothetical protein CHUAL_005311 [Chamberlinius hualienensis]
MTMLNKYTTSNFLSKLFFTWVFSDVWKSFKGRIKIEDLIAPVHLEAGKIGKKWKKEWINEVNNDRSNLFMVLYKTCKWETILSSLVFAGGFLVFALVLIYCLGQFIECFDAKLTINPIQRYLWAIAIAAIELLQAPLMPNCKFISENTGMKIGIGCSSLIFQKILRISTVEISRQRVGQIITAIANDVAKFDYVAKNTLQQMLLPFIIVAYIVFIVFTVGSYALVIIPVFTLMLINNLFIGNYFKKMRNRRSTFTDKRIKLITEMISDIAAVKMLSWENAYYNAINKFRRMEIQQLVKNCILRVVVAVQAGIVTQMATYVFLIISVVTDKDISPKTVFIIFAANIYLRSIIILYFGRSIEQAAYGYVSIQRIQNLLLIPEINQMPKTVAPGSCNHNNQKEISLEFKSCWIPLQVMNNTEQFQLNISICIPRSAITVISGAVGSGKSSLLLSMIKEIYLIDSEVNLEESTGYLPQKPWLFSATVKQNILFGLPYDEIRYFKVIQACALEQDLTMLENGDNTAVDDKGLTLSGGQKSRICLARCLYRNCDIYLLDDPLSAVDVRVENHIYNNCLKNLSHKATIVLVTHRLRNVSNDTHFVYMEKGKISQQGSFGKVIDYINLIDENELRETNLDAITDDVFCNGKLSTIHFNGVTSNKQANVMDTTQLQLIVKGSKSPYIIFFKSALNCCYGVGPIVLLFSIATVAQACNSYFDISVAIWAQKVYVSGDERLIRPLYYMGYILLAEVILFGVLFATYFGLCIRASSHLHRLLLKAILRAEMQFFLKNKTGDIINRFTKDMENIDDTFPLLMMELIRCGCVIIGFMVNIIYSSYISIVAVAFCFVAMSLIAHVYAKCNKLIKQIEAEARSPKYTYVNSTLQGLAVIRSHENQDGVNNEFNRLLNYHTSAWFTMKSFVYLAGVITEFISPIIILIFFIIAVTVPDFLNGSKVGLGISSILLFGHFFEHFLNQCLETDNLILSVKRIKSYIDLPAEDTLKNETAHTQKKCTLQGALSFHNVCLKYGSKTALKSISFDINPGEKIGIVGRTGAGKSSIATVLFRMAPFTGTVTVDGIDIQTVPLSDYRMTLSAIPQNPMILAGSIRNNLDPCNEYSDEELWSVLENVHLKSSIERMGSGLDSQIDHFSFGEKQLCCLARVILRQNKIIVLDEATSNVDNNVDQDIQQIIKQRFKESTILIIAHRLETIMDTDRVMVIHNGEILEFDKPSVLMCNSKSESIGPSNDVCVPTPCDKNKRWVFSDVWKSFKERIKIEDLIAPEHLEAGKIGKKWKKEWINEVNNSRSNLFMVLYKTCKWEAILSSLVFAGRFLVFALVLIYCLGQFIECFDAKLTINPIQSYLWAIAIVAIVLFQAPLMPNCKFISENTGMKIGIGCSSLIFQKILRISTVEISRQRVGQIITAISNDVAKFDYVAKNSLQLLLFPFIIVAYIVFIVFTVGPYALVIIPVFTLMLINNLFIGKYFKKMRNRRSTFTDKRIKLITEMISDIAAVKMLSWENAYYNAINKFRRMEIQQLVKNCILRVVVAVQAGIVTQIATYVFLIISVVTDKDISPKTVFIIFAANIYLRSIIILYFGRSIEQAAYGYVSIQRIQNLLLIPEINQTPKTVAPGSCNHNNQKEISLEFKSCWIPLQLINNTEQFQLNISICIPRPAITVIAGAVGSGKSSLLLSMIKEIYLIDSEVNLEESTGYLPQKPWLFSATVKQNILFGLPYDEIRYFKVIQACALEQDLTMLENGDNTAVDDKGLTLSGGQKSRICLARCLYRNCDIYLLDDPLSAVDVRVENHIYNNCLKNLSHKATIVLVTHRLRNVSNDTHFVYMEKGKISQQGPFGKVIDYINLIDENELRETNLDAITDDVFCNGKLSTIHFNGVTSNKQPNVMDTTQLQLIVKGSKSPYIIFFKSALNCCYGVGPIVLLFSIATVAQACNSYFDISVAIWAQKVYVSGDERLIRPLYYMGYILLAEVILFGVLFALYFGLCIRASSHLHRLLLKAILRAEMQFFYINKTGDIINRFTKDMENIDDTFPLLMMELIRCGCFIVGFTVNIIYSSYISIVAVAFCFVAMSLIAHVYAKCNKLIKQIEAEARSPKYTYVNSTIQGLAVIRSHENQDGVNNEFNRLLNYHTSAWFIMKSFVSLAGVIAEFISPIITLVFLIIAVTVPDFLNGSKVGLGISSLLLLGNVFEHFLNQCLETDNLILSVKRIKSYIDLPAEDTLKNETAHTQKKCTLQGALSFHNVCLKYGSKTALKSISFDINPGEKIGIVGRTGAGKSSIATVLFRMAPFTGTVTVDGIDIQTVPLSDYRMTLSAIPQNPMILAGSIRNNLDPCNEYSDEELWSVLENVHLKSSIERMGSGLDSQIDHFSFGEKQLCCLARVILRQNKIIVLDEATSNVDNNVDQDIQQIIKQRFKESTILIIAHRLETIMDTDRVMVIHNGEILEFDKPSVLMCNSSSVFRKMLNQTNLNTYT